MNYYYILDTNYVVRYLIDSHANQHAETEAFFNKLQKGEIKASLESEVFAEIVFVLSSYYEVNRNDIYEALSSIILYKGFTTNNKDIYLKALDIYTASNLHILDCLIAAKSILYDLPLQTFDKKLLKK